MTTKHSPGPWRKHVSHNSSLDCENVIYDVNNVIIATVKSRHGTSHKCATCQANTDLMAAAPELLEACQAAIRYDNSYNEKYPDLDDNERELLYEDLVGKVHNAIAKAEAPQ